MLSGFFAFVRSTGGMTNKWTNNSKNEDKQQGQNTGILRFARG
jgi:hypothetical protein